MRHTDGATARGLDVEGWNRLPVDEALALAWTWCDFDAWGRGVVASRPHSSVENLLEASHRQFDRLRDADWTELLAKHDRIASADVGALSPASLSEQALVYAGAASGHVDELAGAALAYEAKFGFMFITSARGRTSEAILAECLVRTHRSRPAEISESRRQSRLIVEGRILECFKGGAG